MPEPDSRLTSAVAASSAGGTPLRRRAHGWDGATTTVSVSRPTGPARSLSGTPGASTKPMSAAPVSTAWATSAELTALSATAAPEPAPRSAVSHAGSRYFATVMLAATRSLDSRCGASAVTARRSGLYGYRRVPGWKSTPAPTSSTHTREPSYLAGRLSALDARLEDAYMSCSMQTKA